MKIRKRRKIGILLLGIGFLLTVISVSPPIPIMGIWLLISGFLMGFVGVYVSCV